MPASGSTSPAARTEAAPDLSASFSLVEATSRGGQDVLLDYVDQPRVDDGMVVTITVDADHVTGAWVVWVIPAAEGPA